jgi:very-short-patch-repair endonuclease
MGWEQFMVAVEYDGEQHRTDTVQFRSDVSRSEYIDGLGWRRIRVLAGDRRDEIVRRVEGAGVPRIRR